MKKSTEEVINYLRQYVGHEIIRTNQANGDWSYTDVSPILLIGFTSDGCIICRYAGEEAKYLGVKPFVLPHYYTDYNWITYKEALEAKDNELNKWKGKKIRRIRPNPIDGSTSFMSDNSPPTLISASKHHMVIMYNEFGLEGEVSVLGPGYVNPEDWELVE